MKKLVSWYKKKDKEMETHFTSGLLKINFVPVSYTMEEKFQRYND